MLTLVVAALCLAFSVPVVAQTEDDPVIEEEYKATVNEVGDAKIVDKMTYVNEEDFEYIEALMEENPEFLTRRYTTDSDIGEVENFDTELDSANNTVLITFETPGYAYNMGDHWEIFGFSEEPVEESDSQFEFEGTYVVNSEFTLFTDQVLYSRSIIELPGEASNAVYEPTDGSIQYDMPEVGAVAGFWSEHRTVLIIVFGVLTAVFALLLVLAVTRKTVPKPALSQQTAAPGPPVPASETTATESPKKAGSKEYCENCGNKLKPGEVFCGKCGAKR